MIDTEITVNAFADDHSLQKCFKPINNNESKTIELFKSNLKKAGEWMCQNRPKFNPGKMEYITFGSQQQLNKCRVEMIRVCGQEVIKSRNVKYLGACFDEKLTFQSIDQESCVILVCSLVVSHLDYANCILFGISDYFILKNAEDTKFCC